MTTSTDAPRKLWGETVSLYRDLLKVMVPVMVAVKVAVELGLVDLIAGYFAPVMMLVGLPGEMGIVWVTAIVVNPYAAAAALVTLLPTTALTGADITILATMILVAHSLPIEQRILQQAGVSFLFTTILRLVAAVLLGWLLDTGYGISGTLQEPAVIAWLPAGETDPGWITWLVDSARSLAIIFVILMVLLALLRAMDTYGLTRLIARAMAPVLRLIGIDPATTSMTMTGVLLGITYGGALIMREARSGRVSRKDVFLSSCLLCLSHSLIEDTLFFMALGAHYSGVFVARLVFSILLVALIARVLHRMPERSFNRLLCSTPTA
ncbi:MAG: nucleoside recognition protein [Gammaproteobacteria bacterium]|nr:MAG: nucleoside recognition protein [Gammaproteobacteria bacterium]